MAVMGRTLTQERPKQTRLKRRQRARLAAGQTMMLTQQERVVRVMIALGTKRKQQRSCGGSAP
jgi:hypothetical protein